MTNNQVQALYHWVAEFLIALSESREVWLIETHKPKRIYTYGEQL